MEKNEKKQLYSSIVDQIIEYIALGVFEQDTMIISVRSYASSLGINPNTVQKAYQKLEELGHIISYPKKGSFVKDVEFTKKTYQKKLLTHFKNIVKKINYSDLEQSELIEIINNIYEGGIEDEKNN